MNGNRMTSSLTQTCAIFALVLCTLGLFPQAHAQEEKEDLAGDKVKYELGFHLGNLLPNQISGLTEITGLGGVRGGMRIAPLTYAEAGIIMGNGNDAEWKNLHMDVRMDMPVETLVGIAYVGLDTNYYKGKGQGTQTIFGGHAGGGIQVPLTGNVWFRSEMKFGFSPGTSLYVGFGLVLRM